MTERDVPTSGTPAGPALRPGWEKARSDEGDRPRRHGAATSGVLSALDSWQGRGSGLAPNRAAALAYLAGPFSGALFLVLDEDDPYVRFHAMQSVALTVAWVALWVVVLFVAFLLDFLPLIGHVLAVFLRFVVAAASFGVWLYSLTRAYRGEEWEIPFLGPFVRRLEEVQTEGGAE